MRSESPAGVWTCWLVYWTTTIRVASSKHSRTKTQLCIDQREFVLWEVTGGKQAHQSVPPPPPKRHNWATERQVWWHHTQHTHMLSETHKGTTKALHPETSISYIVWHRSTTSRSFWSLTNTIRFRSNTKSTLTGQNPTRTPKLHTKPHSGSGPKTEPTWLKSASTDLHNNWTLHKETLSTAWAAHNESPTHQFSAITD